MWLTLEGEGGELEGGLAGRDKPPREDVLLELQEELVPAQQSAVLPAASLSHSPCYLLSQVQRVTRVEFDGKPEPNPSESC